MTRVDSTTLVVRLTGRGNTAQEKLDRTPATAASTAAFIAAMQPLVSRVRTTDSAVKGTIGASYWTEEPLTTALLAEHLAGDRPRGACPIDIGSTTTRLALFDLDSHKGATSWHDMILVAQQVCDALEAYGLLPIVWRSSGGRGIHIFVLWERPQHAYSVRVLLGQVLADCGFTSGAKGVAQGQIEVFPKQDEVRVGERGNQFILPLAGLSVPIDMLLGVAMTREDALGLAWPMSADVPLLTAPVRLPTAVGDETPDPISKVIAALGFVPNDGLLGDLDYEAWHRMVCAVHEATGGSDEGLEAVQSWSATNPRHDAKFLRERVWPYIRSAGDRGKAVRRNTLYGAARDNGWLAAPAPNAEGFKDVHIAVSERALLPAVNTPIVDALIQSPTQDNVALIFQQTYAGRLKFSAVRKRWLVWDGKRWQVDATNLAFDFARACARRVNRNGKASISSASFATGVEQFARADREFAVRGDEFDRDNYRLNTPTGTIDLSTGAWTVHNPDDAITLITGAEPARSSGAVFQKFMREITLDDPALTDFLQISLGACLSGACESHWLLFWTGHGRNGKNTLGELVTHVVGAYARKIPAFVLMAKQHEGHPTEIAQLQGVRIAFASEIADGSFWHESRINELTGDETLSARFMGGDFFEFRRTFKLVLYGNHQPQLRSVTDALRSRIKIVPFRASFAGREDPLLPARLRAESGYVLNWLIEGHAKWLAAGRKLPACEAVDEASREYFASQSTVESWIEECVDRVREDERKVLDLPKMSNLYSNYSWWKKERGETPISMTRFGNSMNAHFDRVKSSGTRYRGCRLKVETRFDFDTPYRAEGA
jgi:putative DNA primase/helicase